MQVILDTNILVSGIFWGGIPYKIIELWANNKLDIVISEEILEEYISVIYRISRDKELTNHWKNFILKSSHIVEAKSKVKFSRDKDDDKFIYCALASNSPYIITGDKDLLDIKKVQNIEILKPNEFLKIYFKK